MLLRFISIKYIFVSNALLQLGQTNMLAIDGMLCCCGSQGGLTKSNLIIMLLGLKLAALSLLAALALGSDLSTNNCADSLDLVTANRTSGDYSQSTIDLVYGGVYSSNDQAVLQQSFEQGDTLTVGNLITSMQILYPFVIIAVAFGLAYIIAVCCCIFEKSCPPCQSWKRDFSTNPYEKAELKCTSVFTAVFAISILVVAVVGLILYPDLQQGIAVIKCSLYKTLDVAINGDVSSNWGGFSQMTSQSSNISSLLADAGGAISASFNATNTLPASLAAFRQQNINIYSNNYQSTVISPNHTTPSPVTPLFIANSLGPYTVDTSMTGDIQVGIKQTELITTQGTKVFDSAQLLLNSIASIRAKYNSSLQSMVLNSQYLSTSTESVTNFSSKVMDRYFTQILYTLQGVLAVVMICSILILLGVLATHYFEIYGCKACVHIGWLLYGLMYYGVIALCYLSFAIGGVSYSFCKFYGGLVQNQTLLSSFSASTKPTAFNHIFKTLSPCFFGNGSISATFSLTNEMSTVSQLFNDINTYLNMQDSSKSTYVNLNTSVNKINAWTNVLENYRAGIYEDSPSSIITEDNPLVALQNMNLRTNNGTSSPYPTCTYDYWVFDKTNCSHNSTEAIYTSSITSGTAFVTTGFMCISFNEKFTSSSLNIWSEADIRNRYITRRSCQNDTQTFDSLMSYASSIISYRDARINLYQGLKDQLASLLATNTALNSQIAAFTTNIIIFSANTTSLNSLMTNSISGINYNSNCTVVANNLRLIYNVFCINFVYKSVQLGICCLILLGIMIGGMLTGSVFGIRYNRIEKDPKVYLQQPPSIIEDELASSKRENSSDTSSSSSDE